MTVRSSSDEVDRVSPISRSNYWLKRFWRCILRNYVENSDVDQQLRRHTTTSAKSSTCEYVVTSIASRFDGNMTDDSSFDCTDQCRVYCLSEIWGIVFFREANLAPNLASQRCRLNRFEQSRPKRERKTYKRTDFVSAPSRDISYLYRHSRLIMFSHLTPIVIALFAMAGLAAAQCQSACCSTPPAVGHDVL